MRLHLRKLCRRVLNDRALGSQQPPWEAPLQAALECYVRGELSDLVYFQEPGEPRESSKLRSTYLDQTRAVEAVARSSAAYALAHWTPDYIVERQHRGQVGGRISKRPPSWTDEDLDHLSTAEDAAHADSNRLAAVIVSRSATEIGEAFACLSLSAFADLLTAVERSNAHAQ